MSQSPTLQPTAVPQGTVLPTSQSAPLFQSTTLFSQQNVRQLTSADFNTKSKILIDSNINDCMLVLFYTENQESRNLAQIWANAAIQSIGPVFAAVNLQADRVMAEVFVRLRTLGSHPYQRIGLRGVPFILGYRDGWPVAAYNGQRSTAAIIDYAQTLVCRPDYQELAIGAESIQPDQNLEISGYTTNQTARTSSTQFTSTPVRGYAAQPVVVVGSAAETAEAANLRAAAPQAVAGTATTNSPAQVVAVPAR